MSEFKKLGLIFLVSNLNEFLIFYNFLDLANFSHFDFWDLDDFLVFDSIDFSINLLSSSLPSTF